MTEGQVLEEVKKNIHKIDERYHADSLKIISKSTQGVILKVLFCSGSNVWHVIKVHYPRWRKYYCNIHEEEYFYLADPPEITAIEKLEEQPMRCVNLPAWYKSKCVGDFWVHIMPEYPSSLEDLINEARKRNVYFDEGFSRFIVRQILVALAFTHKAGIVHRDLKPSNIMLSDSAENIISTMDESFNVVVIDFGLAKECVETESIPMDGHCCATSVETMHRQFYAEVTCCEKIEDLNRDIPRSATPDMVTPAYRPPEACRTPNRQFYSYVTDSWSVGVIFKQLIVGNNYFLNKWYGSYDESLSERENLLIFVNQLLGLDKEWKPDYAPYWKNVFGSLSENIFSGLYKYVYGSYCFLFGGIPQQYLSSQGFIQLCSMLNPDPYLRTCPSCLLKKSYWSVHQHASVLDGCTLGYYNFQEYLGLLRVNPLPVYIYLILNP